MRILLATSLFLVACSVPDKQNPLDSDGGVDAPVEPDAPDDDEAPDTTITEAPAEFSREGTAVFAFTSEESDVTFECSFDGETPVACSSPYSRALGDGSHRFMVRATDSAGNSDDTPAEHLWTIDRTAPNTTFTKVPPTADNSVMVRFEFESNEDNVAFECSLDNAAFVACTSGQQFGPIGDGPHSFSARARDRAGNLDASPPVHAWTVDTSTPDTQLLTGPTGDVGSTTATFTFVSPDAGSGATYQCSLDGAAFAACTSPRTYNGLGEGEHTFAVRVRDAVGNPDPTPATRTWRIDLAAPNTTITGGPEGVESSATASFTFTSNEQGSRFECSLDNAAFAACTSPANFASLPQGPHTFAVRAIDAADHPDPTPATRSWTVDTVAPDIDITAGPANGSTVGPRVTVAFTVSEGQPQCSLDAAPFAACTSPLAWNLPEGMHQLRIRATDAAGNVTTVTRAFTVACAAPSATGAAGLLHLDDNVQVLPNAVSGGASATLGDTADPEATDPTFLAAARFAGGLTFSAAESDHVLWPVALPAATELGIELWARPEAVSGTRDIMVSGDGRIAVRVVSANGNNIRFAATIVDAATGGQARTVQSGNVAANQWHHVVVSLGGGALALYVDGEKTTTPVQLAEPLAFDSFTLGGAGPTAYEGALDEVWLAQTAIGSDEAVLGRYCPL